MGGTEGSIRTRWREFHLTQQLTCLQKEPMTPLTDHLQTFKGLCKNLASIEHLVAYKIKEFSQLNSLSARYETFHHVNAQATHALLP